VVIHDGTSNTGVKEMHNDILKTLVLKDDSNITSIIQELVAKDKLVISSRRYSSTGKTHWNDIIEILEEQQEQYKQLSAKLTYQLDLGITEVLSFDNNLVLLNLITNGVPLEKLRILYPKESDELVATGLTDGEKIVGFNEFHYLYYKFNDYLKNEIVTSLVKSEKVSLFSKCKDYEKAIISMIARNKIVVGKRIDYYSVTERTIDKWERELSEIVVDIDDKISECAKITKLKPSQITLIIRQLKQKGLV
jgi:DNA-binding MarR family transcriptional regulator